MSPPSELEVKLDKIAESLNKEKIGNPVELYRSSLMVNSIKSSGYADQKHDLKDKTLTKQKVEKSA